MNKKRGLSVTIEMIITIVVLLVIAGVVLYALKNVKPGIEARIPSQAASYIDSCNQACELEEKYSFCGREFSFNAGATSFEEADIRELNSEEKKEYSAVKLQLNTPQGVEQAFEGFLALLEQLETSLTEYNTQKNKENYESIQQKITEIKNTGYHKEFNYLSEEIETGISSFVEIETKEGSIVYGKINSEVYENSALYDSILGLTPVKITLTELEQLKSSKVLLAREYLQQKIVDYAFREEYADYKGGKVTSTCKSLSEHPAWGIYFEKCGQDNDLCAIN